MFGGAGSVSLPFPEHLHSEPTAMGRSATRGAPARIRAVAAVLSISLIWTGCQASEAREDAALGLYDTPGDTRTADPVVPGVRQTGPNRYEAVVIAFEGGFDPIEIRVPVGAEVRFRVRSADVGHGIQIEGTDIAIEAPEGVGFSEATYTFTEAGEYPFLCHIYCIGGHELMTGVVIVE